MISTSTLHAIRALTFLARQPRGAFGFKLALFSPDDWSCATNKVWLWTGCRF